MSVFDSIKHIVKMTLQSVQIEGFFNSIEGISFYYLIQDKSVDGEVVEIGSFKGKSTFWLASSLRDGGFNQAVNCVDSFTGSEEHKEGQKFESKNIFNDFRLNMFKNGLKDYVKVFPNKSEVVVKNWDKPIRFLFIDGSHEYEDVRHDFIEWSKFVVPGGIIALHDTIKWDGPKSVAENFISNNENYDCVTISSTLIAKKLR